MTWKKIRTLVRRVLQETSEINYSDDVLTQYGHLCQKEIADEVIEEFATTRTFSTDATNQEYSIKTNLGPDVKGIYKLTYDGYVVDLAYEEDWIAKTTLTGKPGRYGLRGRDTIVFQTTPGEIKTVKAWCYRKPPTSVMTLYHDGTTDSVSAVTAAIAGNTLTLTATGGTGVTSTFDLTAAANDTLTELIAAINALALGYTAAITPEGWGGENSANLNEFTAVSIKGAGAIIDMYLEPILGHEYERCLVNGILYWAFTEKAHDPVKLERAKIHLGLYEAEIAKKKTYSLRVKQGFKDRSRLAAEAIQADGQVTFVGG